MAKRTEKVAALYWPTSSVGGINTELRALRDAADERGDTFHVLRSGKQKSLRPGLFAERKLIRGGDTFITIDGECPHTDGKAAAEWLKAQGYTRVYLAFLCPHPTKDYGNVPVFLTLLEHLNKAGIPITGRVTDGYWDSYADWGNRTANLCASLSVCQPAYLAGLPKGVKVARQPFSPRKAKEWEKPGGKLLAPKRADRPLTVWTSQWKAIKGIHKLLPHIPEIKTDVELFSNGILYYQLRDTPAWRAAVGRDWFGETTPSGGFSGSGRAPFFGHIPLEDIPNVLTRAWFMIDLQGIGKPKNKVYTEGSYNCTTVEAMYYGACPVLHAQAAKVVPTNLALFAGEASDVPGLVNSKVNQDFALNKNRQKKAKEWVLDNFLASKVYDIAVLGRKA